MKQFGPTALTLGLLVFAGPACHKDVPPEYLKFRFTAVHGEAISFAGEFGKHDLWEKAQGTTPAELEFDLQDWPQCFCQYWLRMVRALPGTDTMHVAVWHQGLFVCDTLYTGQDSLLFAPHWH